MGISKELFLTKLKEHREILTPIQNKISLPILNRICKKMQQNLKFKSIWVSNDNIIVEGHHRYIGSIIVGYGLGVVSDYPKPNIFNSYDWNNVSFVEEDWDTPSKIRMLNEEDALYNEMSIEDVETIIA